MNSITTKFYLALLSRDGKTSGYAISPDSSSFSPEPEGLEKLRETEKPVVSASTPSFLEVFNAFVSIMEWYRKFIPLNLGIMPRLSATIAESVIGDFAKRKGTPRPDLSTQNAAVYELDVATYREFRVIQDQVDSTFEGVDYLPEVMVIGLVSAYDAFLTRLLRVVLNRRNEIVFTSDKTIKFSELVAFGSIEAAKTAIIDREIEAVMRGSHHEQFAWMEKRFDLALRKDLSAWAGFVELCERRNLLTHTGGVVSAQYLENCRAHKVHVGNLSVGDKLPVTNQYFSEAVLTVYEIGLKLCFVLWRKFAPDQQDAADKRLSEHCFDLIFNRAYSLAESVLSFTSDVLKKYDGSDMTRRMMIVNYANAIRLQKREGEARRILENEDWSAVGNNFQICVAAVKGDMEEVIQLMQVIGRTGALHAEDYRSWPVFRNVRTDDRFLRAFEEVFGEPVIKKRSVEIANPALVPETKH